MKLKKLLSIMLAALLCAALAACGGGGEEPDTDADTASPAPVTADPAETDVDSGDAISGPSFIPELNYDYDLAEYISLPEHSALKLDVTLLTVTDADVEAVIQDALASAGRSTEITDRGAKTGDTVNYSVTGTRIDTGDEIDSAQSRTAVIGSEAYLAGFAENLIGARAGDTRTFDYTYPADYYTKSLAGVTARFTVTVISVSQADPAALDDSFVRSLGIDGVTDVAGYREYVRSVMQNNADAENEQTLRDAVYDVIDAGAEVLKWPEKEWNYYKSVCDRKADNFSTLYGISRESYITQTYGSAEAFDAYVEDYCQTNVKKDMITYSLAREYGATVDPDEYKRELLYGFDNFAASYGVETLADFEKMFSTDLSTGLLLASALNAVAKTAVVD